MKNTLLDKGIITPSGEISKDKINLVAGAITQPFAEMVWVTTGGDISTNLEAVTAQYVDVRLERKQSVLQTYHKALQPKTTVTGKEAGQETSKKAKKKSNEMEL